MRKFLVGLLVFSFISVFITEPCKALERPYGWRPLNVAAEGDEDPLGADKAAAAPSRDKITAVHYDFADPYGLLLLILWRSFDYGQFRVEYQDRETVKSQKSIRQEEVQRSHSGN